MKKLAVAAMSLAVLCSGCAIVGGGRPSEDSGEKVWSIMASHETWAFNSADDLCPHGYYVHNELPNRPLPPLYLMEIECKPESSGQVNLVLTPPKVEAYNPQGIGKPGQYSYQIERMPEVLACNEKPLALVESKGPGIEEYNVDCSNGNQLAVRCEFSVCSVK